MLVNKIVVLMAGGFVGFSVCLCVCVFGLVWGFLERTRDFQLSILLPVVVSVSV